MKRFVVIITSFLLIFTITTVTFAQGKSPPNSSAGDTYFISFTSDQERM